MLETTMMVTTIAEHHGRHYMCFLYLGKRMMEELNFYRDPNFGAPLEALWSDEQVRKLCMSGSRETSVVRWPLD